MKQYFIFMSVATLILAALQYTSLKFGNAKYYYKVDEDYNRERLVKNGVFGIKTTPLTFLVLSIPAGVVWPLYWLYLILLTFEKKKK